MILVDTSVFIDFQKEKVNPSTEKFNTLLELNIPFGITSTLSDMFSNVASSEFKVSNNGKLNRQSTSHIYFLCKKEGITVRSTIDCLIVQIAKEHHLKLLHHDSDFDNIKKVIKTLECF